MGSEDIKILLLALIAASAIAWKDWLNYLERKHARDVKQAELDKEQRP